MANKFKMHFFDAKETWNNINLKKLNLGSNHSFIVSYADNYFEEEQIMNLPNILKSPQAIFEGAGSEGSVYRIIGERSYAVKVMNAENINPKYLLRESNILNELRHKRLVSVFYFFLDRQEDKGYLAMEYMDGGTVGELIKKEKQLTVCRSLKIITQVLKGVEYIHQRRVLHSDIKPGNILLTQSGDVKLADFGLAVHLNSVSTHNRGDFVGTLYYCSPEVLDGDPRSHENDCWGVGATLGENDNR